jgi:SAM-dependent methyltransferase
MNERYWDGVAPSYDDQIFNTLANDLSGVIRRRIDKIASAERTVGDFGCGVGKYVRLLSDKFKIVHAIDHSSGLLDIAKRNCGNLPNVNFLKADLSDPKIKLPRVDCAISINVLLTPDVTKRSGVLRTIHRTLEPGGPLVMVVPSLESSLYSIARLSEWNRKSGSRHIGVSAEALTAPRKMRGAVFRGVIFLDDQRTKHFIREELELLVRSAGFELESIEKVEYSWRYEFPRPPRWMKAPYPWDWLVQCRKM